MLQIYLFILILPWTRLRDRLTLPSKLINSSTFNAFCINLHAIFCYSKKKFLRLHRYISHARLSTINRSRLFKLHAKSHRIMCRGFYRSGLFDPIYTFGLSYIPVRILWVSYQVQKRSNILEIYVQKRDKKFCYRVSQPSIMFSYKAQVDDAMDEDTVSLPHQQSFSSLKTDSDYIYQVHTPSIHMPLYDSQALKSSPSKHKTSLHSLTSTKDSKNGSGHTYETPTALYQSTSGIKSFTRRLSAEKSSSDFKNYPLTKSDNFIDYKKSALDLKFTHNAWKSSSTSQFKYGGPSSVSNLFSPNTASSFLYKPGSNDSNTNLFSLTTKNSLIHERKRSEGNVPSQFFDIPPLENTLQSILDNSTNGSNEMRYSTSNEEAFVKDIIAQASHNTEKKESSCSKQYTDTEMSEIDVEDTSDSTDALQHVTQQLLSKPVSSTSEEMLRKQKKKDAKKKESGGLSEYLLSLTSPTVNVQSNEKSTSNEVDPSPSPSDTKFYTQTESL